MIIAMFLFASGDAAAKFLSNSYHPAQIIWFRQLGLFVGVCLMLCISGTSVLKTKQPTLQITRGVLVVLSSVVFVFAIRHVALADAVAISFVAPFFLTLLAAVLLKEKVGIRRWSAVVVGFVGALIIIRPGMGVVHQSALLIILAAALFAGRQVIGRLLADTDKTTTTIAYTAIAASLLISLFLPFVWEFPKDTQAWMLFILIGILAAIAEILIIVSLELTEAATVAPMHYTIILWGTLYGFLFFDQLPDLWTLVGTVIIIAAGIYTLKRSEARAGKATKP
ncbi:MAG: DMT family transporter [Gammaproteobacteria bacterium]|nr:DMT family transporter [Gammaproteobacteria bacterium]